MPVSLVGHAFQTQPLKRVQIPTEKKQKKQLKTSQESKDESKENHLVLLENCYIEDPM